MGTEELDVLKLSGKMHEIQLDAKGNAMYKEQYQTNVEEYKILPVLMRRDGMSRADAEDLIAEARERVEDGEDPEEILADEFGLEPDYIYDLLG